MSNPKLKPTCGDCPLCRPGLSCPFRNQPIATDAPCAAMLDHLQAFRTLRYVNDLHEADLKALQIQLKAHIK